MFNPIFPQILEIYRRKTEQNDSKKLEDSLPSREEEEKHQKLLAENEELKKQIQEVSEMAVWIKRPQHDVNDCYAVWSFAYTIMPWENGENRRTEQLWIPERDQDNINSHMVTRCFGSFFEQIAFSLCFNKLLCHYGSVRVSGMNVATNREWCTALTCFVYSPKRWFMGPYVDAICIP